METGTLLWGMMVSSIGLGYFLYGKKQQRIAALLAGILLMVAPYFLGRVLWILLFAAGTMVMPLFWKS